MLYLSEFAILYYLCRTDKKNILAMKYIERLIDSQLLAWKESASRKPLLLRGARQVGKSCAVRHLGESFEYYIEVNFEKRPELKQLFQRTTQVRDLATNLGLLFGQPVVPGKTLLFLDEIQSSPEALKSLWFFKEDFPELHVIAAGSLLEFALKNTSSYGVGRIRSLFMYPLSFDEFLAAQGKSAWVNAKRLANADQPLFEALHQGCFVERARKRVDMSNQGLRIIRTT